MLLPTCSGAPGPAATTLPPQLRVPLVAAEAKPELLLLWMLVEFEWLMRAGKRCGAAGRTPCRAEQVISLNETSTHTSLCTHAMMRRNAPNGMALQFQVLLVKIDREETFRTPLPRSLPILQANPLPRSQQPCFTLCSNFCRARDGYGR